MIFSDSPRIIVEAPAGYGKTTTMISRIAYLFATGRIPNPKRILGLTFSVGRNKKAIAEYIRNQLTADKMSDQMTIKEYYDPFTGEPVNKSK